MTLTRPGLNPKGYCRGGHAQGVMAARRMGNHQALRVMAPTICDHFGVNLTGKGLNARPRLKAGASFQQGVKIPYFLTRPSSFLSKVGKHFRAGIQVGSPGIAQLGWSQVLGNTISAMGRSAIT
jgi:hypothetical protein